MMRHIGLPGNAMELDFDQLYVAQLLEQVRSSSLGAVVILAMDHVYREDGTLWENFATFHVPNDYVLALARKHPEFVPAVSIHPGRPDALEELDRCVAGGAAMLKLLPNCHHVSCSERRHTRFWERMAEHRLPLLSHTGGEHTLPQTDPRLADPLHLKLPLEIGVNVIAAHSATKSGLGDPDYLPVLIDLMQRHPNLYADNSAFQIPIRSRAFRPTLTAPVVDRLLHGSDFPVLVYGHWAWMRGLIDWATFRRWQKHPNVLERDYQWKRAVGYPDEVFTRGWRLLRPGATNVPA
jgi:predicted TIM-barrel fold metal-dependent hydrolase